MTDHSLSREERLALYMAAIEDYKFQVNLTWSRTQYSLTLNAGLLGVAGTLLKLDDDRSLIPVMGLLFAGMLFAVLSFIAQRAGRSYYTPVVERMRALEESLGVSEQHATRNTSRQGGKTPRVKVTNAFQAVIVILGLVDATGIAYCVTLMWVL